MSKQREALQMALEALQWNWGGEPLPTLEIEAIEALKRALAEPEQGQEPYAWHWTSKRMDGSSEEKIIYAKHYLHSPNDLAYVLSCAVGVKELYTAPPVRKPLTDDELKELWKEHGYKSAMCMKFARAIEKKIRGEA